MNAFMLLPMAIGIAAAIYSANMLNHWLTVAIFVASIGLAIYLIVEERLKRRAKPTNTVNHAMLMTKKFLPCIPLLKENLRGQDAQIEEIANSIQDELLLANPGKIIGAYILVGPTGTGKTLMGQLVAKALYPNSPVIELHLNQLKHADDVFTLIGPPPGRPGYEVGGSLTRPVLQNPYRVVVMNEITACHPDLHDCLYNILDTGQCQEKSSGKTVDFSGCVFFGTSNVGYEHMQMIYKRTGDSLQRDSQCRDVMHEEGKLDRAFLARWNKVLLFDELEPVHVAEVALLQMYHQWKQFGMEITYVAPEVLVNAVERNEDFHAYGVRQLSVFIRDMANKVIGQARAAKMTRVYLDVTPEGKLVAKPVTQAKSGS